ncbi:MAG: hypothetical protein ISS27_03230 [Candidatus Omnitrophica bacterium]|nr:hypothetical protein [Candidatus Omnitrophota bacterium]
MGKGRIKNILLVFLLTIAIFSIFRYVVIFREKLELVGELAEVKKEIITLQGEKQKLIQDIEKEKKEGKELSQKVAGLKGNLGAAQARIARLFAEYNQTEKKLEDLGARFSLLKSENDALVEENKNIKAKLSSSTGLKQAMRQLKEQAFKVTKQIIHKADEDKLIEGNNGYLLKDGKPTYPAKIKVEITPATPDKND